MPKSLFRVCTGLLAGALTALSLPACNSGGEQNAAQTTAEAPVAQTAGPTDSTRQFVRLNLADPKAEADVAALRTAMAKMRQLPCTDPRSWYYQGGIHWVPDQVANGNPLCKEYQTKKDAMPGWRNCTHAPGSKLHFLIWHRLYTYYLERIVRQLSGKADFALPYWDYTDPQHRVMPAAFRQDKQSSLYESARFDSLNRGFPITPALMNAALDVSQLDENRIFSEFNSQINDAPHGAMHDFIGNGLQPDSLHPKFNQIFQKNTVDGMMGDVSSAAFDPIFWVHHANIDYLWARWDQSPNGQRPILDSLQAHPWAYTFFDENGKRVNFTVAEAYAKAFSLDYRYEGLAEKGPLLAARGPAPAQGKPATTVGTTKVGKTVTGSTSFAVKFPLKTAGGGLLKGTAAPDPNQRLLLKIVVQLTKEPKGVYEVYIKNQSDTTPLVAKDHLAGVLSFFGAAHHASMPGHAEHMASGKMGSFPAEFTFDVTDEVDLRRFDGNVQIQVVKRGGRAETLKLDTFTLFTQSAR